jgi:predicted O-linked N-acetylglucosamine transferase (SPINDLY family)
MPEMTIEQALAAAREHQRAGRVANLRRTLRERMRASPLCDGRAYAQSVESQYRQMWQRW